MHGNVNEGKEEEGERERENIVYRYTEEDNRQQRAEKQTDD